MNGFVVVNPRDGDAARLIAGRLGILELTDEQRRTIDARIVEMREEMRAEGATRNIHRHEVAKERLTGLREAAPAWRLQWETAAWEREYDKESETLALLPVDDAYFEYVQDEDLVTEIVDRGMPPQEVLDEWVRACHCCEECYERPCGAVQQGGVCENVCRCDERDDSQDGYDPNGCPGCGGNCQTACR